jgi:hypothetical protein
MIWNEKNFLNRVGFENNRVEQEQLRNQLLIDTQNLGEQHQIFLRTVIVLYKLRPVRFGKYLV